MRVSGTHPVRGRGGGHSCPSLHLPPTEAFAVCQGYDPPEGFLPDLTKPLLDHSYGESQSPGPLQGRLCPLLGFMSQEGLRPHPLVETYPLWNFCPKMTLSPTLWWKFHPCTDVSPRRIFVPVL